MRRPWPTPGCLAMKKEQVSSICSLLFAEAGNLCLEVGFELKFTPRYLVLLTDSILVLTFVTY
jgi:hypothetical protein